MPHLSPRLSNAPREWNGMIDDLRIYSNALSQVEIKALHEGKDPPLRRE